MQANISLQRNNSALPIFLLLLAMLILALVFAVVAALPVDVSGSHAIERHGESVVLAVRNCLTNNGVMQTWVNPDTGRRAQLCQIDAKTYGVQIIELRDNKWHEVSAFLKDKMSRVEQVMKYMSNRGYILIH